MLVSDIMNRNVISAYTHDSVLTAAKVLSRECIGSLPVCHEDDTLCGVITDRDIVTRCVAYDKDPGATPISEVMTRHVISIGRNASIKKAAALMSSEQIRRLPVVEHDKLVGILSLGDMAKNRDCEMEASSALTDISLNIKGLSFPKDYREV